VGGLRCPLPKGNLEVAREADKGGGRSEPRSLSGHEQKGNKKGEWIAPYGGRFFSSMPRITISKEEKKAETAQGFQEEEEVKALTPSYR